MNTVPVTELKRRNHIVFLFYLFLILHTSLQNDFFGVFPSTGPKQTSHSASDKRTQFKKESIPDYRKYTLHEISVLFSNISFN